MDLQELKKFMGPNVPKMCGEYLEEYLDTYEVDVLSMDDHFRDCIEDSIGGFKTPDFDIVPKSLDSKWRCVSAMQKSIRRGDVDFAQKTAWVVHQIDPQYLWKRLGVIAVEDVGFGGLIETALTFAASRFKKFRVAWGEKKTVCYIVKLLAEAVKDRSLCDLICIAYNVKAPLVENPEYFLVTKSKDPIERMLATCQLCGIDKHPTTDFEYDLWIASAGYSTLIQYLTSRAKKTQMDAMWAGYPLVDDIISTTEYELEIQDNGLEPNEKKLIKGLPPYAYDMYTTEGKKAMDYFAMSSGKMAQFLQKHGLKPRTVRIAVFTFESALLDREIRYTGREAIYTAMYRADASDFKMSPEQLDQMRVILEADADKMQKARETVA